MANEITLTAKLSVTNGNFTDERNANRISITQSSLGAQGGVQNIGTSHEAISLGDVSTEGYVWMRNLDDTNFVQVGLDGGASLTPVIRMNAGESCVFRLDAAATLYAEADTAACDLDILILEA